MADIKSPSARSENMSRIRSRDTKPEEYIRKLLFSRGFRYRKNAENVLGHPDAWLAKYNTAVFVNGCFWHRHENCKYAYTPKSRIEFWLEKFRKNQERDEVVRQGLAAEHVKMLVIWECTVKQMMRDRAIRDNVMKQMELFLVNTESFLEL